MWYPSSMLVKSKGAANPSFNTIREIAHVLEVPIFNMVPEKKKKIILQF